MWYRALMVLVACSSLFALAISSATAAAPAETKTHTGKVVSTSEGTLVMSDADGSNEHSHAIDFSCKITLDGKPAKLEDLKKGYSITVTTEQNDGKDTVTEVTATS